MTAPGTKGSMFVETRLLNIQIPFVWTTGEYPEDLYIRVNYKQLRECLNSSADGSSAWDALNRLCRKLNIIHNKTVHWIDDESV